MSFEYFGEEEDDLERAQSIYTAFAKMESRHKEYDRARMVYKVCYGACDTLLIYIK